MCRKLRLLSIRLAFRWVYVCLFFAGLCMWARERRGSVLLLLPGLCDRFSLIVVLLFALLGLFSHRLSAPDTLFFSNSLKSKYLLVSFFFSYPLLYFFCCHTQVDLPLQEYTTCPWNPKWNETSTTYSGTQCTDTNYTITGLSPHTLFSSASLTRFLSCSLPRNPFCFSPCLSHDHALFLRFPYLFLPFSSLSICILLIHFLRWRSSCVSLTKHPIEPYEPTRVLGYDLVIFARNQWITGDIRVTDLNGNVIDVCILCFCFFVFVFVVVSVCYFSFHRPEAAHECNALRFYLLFLFFHWPSVLFFSVNVSYFF